MTTTVNSEQVGRSCVLHIGAPKTGSTALQAFLSANREGLRLQGWTYPDVSLRGYGHHDLAFLSGGGYPEWATPQPRPLADLVADLRNVAAHAGKLILSSENFYLLRRPTATAEMLESAGIQREQVRIVVYLRRQDEAHVSWYNQVVKAQGYTGTFERCIAQYRDLWDYESNLGEWAEVFGADAMIVRRYVCDDLSRWDVRRDFLSAAGIAPDGLDWPPETVNTRINRDLLELQRWMNRLPLSPQKKRRFHRQLMGLTAASAAQRIFGDEQLLDGERRARLMQEYAASNARVAGRFFGGSQLFEANGAGPDAIAPVTGVSLWRKLVYTGRWFIQGREKGARSGKRVMPTRLQEPKYFVIGFNKTGTTSVRDELGMLGFKVANYRIAQNLANECYFSGDWQPIIDFCRTAQVFKDAPFSYPGTFRKIDAALPGSRFILTIRDTDEQWCDSLIQFHSRMFGAGKVPTAEDLRRAGRRRRAWLKKWSMTWRGYRLTLERRTRLPVNVMRLYGTSPEDPYNRERLKAAYNRHNREVTEHFADRPDDLLVINVSRPEDYQRLLKFVGMTSPRSGFPWSRKGS